MASWKEGFISILLLFCHLISQGFRQWNFRNKGLIIYPAMVTFLGNITHNFQRLQALKKFGHFCMFALHVHSVACLGRISVFPKTVVTSSNFKIGIMPKQQSPFGDQHIYHSQWQCLIDFLCMQNQWTFPACIL